MKRKKPFLYLHMSTRALLALAVFVTVGGVVMYLLIINRVIEPASTKEEIHVEAAFAPYQSSEHTPEPTVSPAVPTPVPSEEVSDTEDAAGSFVVLSEYATLYPGDDNQSVLRLRQRLTQLGYMDFDAPSTGYNSVLEAAVGLFQRSAGLTVTGIADADLQTFLFSAAAPPYRIRLGDTGDDVSSAQLRLKELGYYSDRTTGYFGPKTEAAVKLFEYRSGLSDDGVLDVADLKQLYSIHAGPNPDYVPDGPASSSVQTVRTEATYVHSGEGLSHAVSDQVGMPYFWGKEGPDAFDGSGLISYCLKLCGISVSKTDAEGYAEIESWQMINKIPLLKKGDLLFFTNDAGSEITHVGISIGTSYFVHASSSSGQVVISSLSEPYWERNFVCARRIFNG